MKKNTLILLLMLFLFSNKFFGQNTNKDNNYTFKRGDYNGIGKWYMGMLRYNCLVYYRMRY